LVLLGAQAPPPGPLPCLTGCPASSYRRRCAGEAAVTNHKSVLQTGTTDPGWNHRVGVTSDEAENPPRLRVTCGEDSKESKPPITNRVETHTAKAEDSSVPVPWRWRSRAARIIRSQGPRPRSLGCGRRVSWRRGGRRSSRFARRPREPP